MIATIKTELTKKHVWRTRLDLERGLLTYIGCYHQSRLHRSLSGNTPNETAAAYRPGGTTNRLTRSYESLAEGYADGAQGVHWAGTPRNLRKALHTTSTKEATVTQRNENSAENETTEPEEVGDKSFDLGPTHSGAMGGGASGPRDLSPDDGRDTADEDVDPGKAGRTGQTGGRGIGTQGSSNVVGRRHKGTGHAQAPPERGQEEIENYGSRRDDTSDKLLS